MTFLTMEQKHMQRWNTIIAAAALAAILPLAACAENPADSVPAAQVSNGPAADPEGMGGTAAENAGSSAGDSAAPADAAVEDATDAGADLSGAAVADPAGADAAPLAGTGPIPLTGTIAVLASKVTRTHRLVFQEWTGTLDPGDGSPSSASLSFEVRTASVVSDPDDRGMMSEKLDEHLKSGDFLDVESFPTAAFASTAIQPAADGTGYTITGDLTVKGITQSITFPATVTTTAGTIAAKAEFSLNRKDFNVMYEGKPDDLVREAFVLQIDVQGQVP